MGFFTATQPGEVGNRAKPGNQLMFNTSTDVYLSVAVIHADDPAV